MIFLKEEVLWYFLFFYSVDDSPKTGCTGERKFHSVVSCKCTYEWKDKKYNTTEETVHVIAASESRKIRTTSAKGSVGRTNAQWMVSFRRYCVSRGWSPYTLITYELGAKMFLKYLALADKQIGQLTEADFGEFLYKLEFPAWRPGMEAAPEKSKRREIGTVRTYGSGALAFIRYLQRSGVSVPGCFAAPGCWPDPAVSGSPSAQSKAQRSLLPIKKEEPPKVIPGAVLSVLLAFAKEHSQRDYALLLTLFSTGMRIGEALGLKLQDVDPRAGKIHVKRRTDNPNGAIAKDGYGRDLPLDGEALEAFNEYLGGDAYRKALQHMKAGARDREYVFLTTWRGRGTMHALTYDDVRHMMRALWERAVEGRELPAGATRVTPHMMGHTFATQLIEAGWSAEDVRVLMGHKSVRTTIDTYVHASTAQVGEHLRAINGERVARVVPPKE